MAIQSGLMDMRRDAIRLEKMYREGRNNAVANMILDYCKKRQGDYIPITEFSAAAGVTPRVIRKLFIDTPQGRVKHISVSSLDPKTNTKILTFYPFHSHYPGDKNIRAEYRVSQIPITYAAINADGTPDMNNSFTRIKKVWEVAFFDD